MPDPCHRQTRPRGPQIRVAVEAWNPRTDPVPLHQWLFPWLEHLAGPLEEVYPGVRQKLAAALTAWDPYDGSAKALLQPWQRVSWQRCRVTCHG